MKKPDKTPDHLSVTAAAWFAAMQTEYGIYDAGGLSLLTAAAEAMDRCRSAREAIEHDGGPVVEDRFGQQRAHPAASIERDSRSQFIQALKALHLDIEPLRDGPGRPENPLGWLGDHAN